MLGMVTEMLHLSDEYTEVKMTDHDRMKAFDVAFRITMSPHEHEWTTEEQQLMAQYCLWASQRLSAVEFCVNKELGHRRLDTPIESGSE